MHNFDISSFTVCHSADTVPILRDGSDAAGLNIADAELENQVRHTTFKCGTPRSSAALDVQAQHSMFKHSTL
jgi:hypothetical protein